MVQILSHRLEGKLKKTQAVVLFSAEGAKLLPEAASFDEAHGKVLTTAVKASSRFQGGKDEVFVLPTPSLENVDAVVLVGIGKPEKMKEHDWRLAGITIAKALDKLGVKAASVMMEAASATESAALAEGVELGIYRFDRFKTKQKAHQKSVFETLTLLFGQKEAADAASVALVKVAAQTAAVNLARDLVNLPPNIANPDLMAEEAAKLAKLGLRVDVLGERQMEKLGMNLLLAVGRGAKQESRLITLKYNGDKSSDKVYAIVGKGVMFDTGGYNLKPSNAMDNMKGDMAGAAAVMGAMRAIAEMKLPINVVGVCGCVMNMVSSEAFLPEEVIVAYNGMTVEIGNTDAEGRLVLGDALAYIVKQEKPAEIIDLATLTGSCMAALGSKYAGLFSTSDAMSDALKAAGENTGEQLWRMPIDECYACKTKIADLNNNGSRFGGASSAAVFLKNFVGETPWAHLDIAGVAICEKIPGELPLEGASGYGVRLLVRYFEEKARSGGTGKGSSSKSAKQSAEKETDVTALAADVTQSVKSMADKASGVMGRFMKSAKVVVADAEKKAKVAVEGAEQKAKVAVVEAEKKAKIAMADVEKKAKVMAVEAEKKAKAFAADVEKSVKAASANASAKAPAKSAKPAPKAKASAKKKPLAKKK